MDFKNTFGFPTGPPVPELQRGIFLVIWEKWFYEKGHNFSFAWSI
jgi:hypothetical protein